MTTQTEVITAPMVGGSVEGLAQLLRGLADVNRLRIINLLLHRNELCVCDIERVLDMSQTKVSRHLTILRNSGLVLARREGRWMYYSLHTDSEFKHLLFDTLRGSGCCVLECMQDIETLHASSDSCVSEECCI